MMPGPMPKNPTTRARGNRTSTNAVLRPVENAKIPPIPTGRKWHPSTRRWWKTIWSSPMSSEYDESDKEALVRLAMLQDEFYKNADDPDGTVNRMLNLSAEIRQQEMRFGLSPMDRRRLQWTIEQGESAEQKTEARRKKQQAEKPELSVVEDPREMLA